MEETDVKSWEELKNKSVEPLLGRVCSPPFSCHQLKVLFSVYNDEMAGDSRRFTDWFLRTTSTYEDAQKRSALVARANDQEGAVGQHGRYWPVMHNENLVIHFRRPVESAVNLHEGDCFFDVPFITEEHAGSLSFSYVRGSEVLRKPIPSEELQTAFTEDYLDKLLSENGSTINSHNLIVMNSQGQIKRLPLVEFVLHHVEHSDVRQDIDGQSEQQESLTLQELDQQNVKDKATQVAQQVSSAYHGEALSAVQSSDQAEHNVETAKLEQRLEATERQVDEMKEQLKSLQELPNTSSSKSGEALFENQRRETLLTNARKYLPERIRQIGFGVRSAIASKMDAPHPQCKDWRMVADKLGVSNDEINAYSATASREKTPTMLVLEHCGEMPCATLIEVLEQLEMFTVLEVICQHGRQREEKLGRQWRSEDDEKPKSPGILLTRTVSSPADYLDKDREEMHQGRTTIWPPPVDISTGASADIPVPLQVSTNEREDITHCGNGTADVEKPSHPHIKYLYDAAARDLWTSISSGTLEEKPWNAFWEAIKTSFGKVHPTVEKGLFHILVNTLGKPKTSFSKRREDGVLIRMEVFTRLIKWFGPALPGDQGFIKKVEVLVTKSRVNRNKASWFAGHMDQSEARSALTSQPGGTFLVRFSETLADEGGFALEVAVDDDDPVSFHIESQPERGLLYFHEGDHKEDEFESLVDLIDRLKTMGISSDYPLLRGPCPSLPFSSETVGYSSSGRSK